MVWLPVDGHVGRLGLEESGTVLQLKRHRVDQNALEEVDESGFAPGHGGE